LSFHQGTIERNQVAYFEIPIPASFGNSTSKKWITVTTVHYPEVQKWGLESYLGVDLKWRMFRGDITREKVSQAMSAGDDENEESVDTGDVERPNEL